VATTQIVIDTSVFVAALHSQLGASYRLLGLVGTGRFDINLSVPLVLEYEEVAKRALDQIGLNPADVDEIIDYLCSVAVRRLIYYLWRPVLPDRDDDMVLEVAVAGECEFIVTYNEKDFRGAEQFGVSVISPQEFLKQIGVSP
jgi:putative PIN family toxin of toxin-antitoxin system